MSVAGRPRQVIEMTLIRRCLIAVLMVVGFQAVDALSINATGSSFAFPVYQVTTFAYEFVDSNDTVTYTSTGSGAGKCNVMGFWSTSNLGNYPSSAVKLFDQTHCGASPRDTTRLPLVDFAGSDSLFSSSDYTAFPDLVMYPAMVRGTLPLSRTLTMLLPRLEQPLLCITSPSFKVRRLLWCSPDAPSPGYTQDSFSTGTTPPSRATTLIMHPSSHTS